MGPARNKADPGKNRLPLIMLSPLLQLFRSSEVGHFRQGCRVISLEE